MNRISLIYGTLLFFITVIFTYRVDANTYDSLTDSADETPWKITSDEISYDLKTDKYILKGNIEITKKGISLSADSVRFDKKNMKVFAEGHVVIKTENDMLTGNSFTLDLNNEVGTLNGGSIFLKENNYIVTGEKIEKVGKHSYIAERISVTTCDGKVPAWKITGRKLNVTIEGYGIVQHAVLWAKKVPVFYSPYLVFPAKTKRQSGFLTPMVSGSDRKGIGYEQPFFWAINKSSDMTIYNHYMEKRGYKVGLEYRYVLNELSKGTMMFDALNDNQVDDGTPESSSKWGYNSDLEGDSYARPDSERYWFRMKHDQSVPLGFTSKLDLDIVSDQDYLREFKDGYSGFKSTDNYFLENFDRGIDKEQDFTRLNRFNLNRMWTQSSLNIELRWYDNVIARTFSEPDTTIQQLPVVTYNGSMQQIKNTPLFLEFDSEYDYFYRQDVDDPEMDVQQILRCHRADIYPKFYLPMKLKNYLAFSPSIGLRETIWHVDEFNTNPSEMEDTQSRGIYDINLDLSTELYRVFPWRNSTKDKIKHTLKPIITYNYVPDYNQDNYPAFNDSVDLIVRENLLTFSLINTFTSRTNHNNLQKRSSENTIYRQFCRFKLEQGYDINEENEDNPERWRNGITKEPLSPLYAELEFNPNAFFSLTEKAEWTYYESEILFNSIELKLSDKRGDSIRAEHRYTKDPLESIYESENLPPKDSYDSSESIITEFNVVLTNRLSTYGNYERDLMLGENVKTGIGFLFKAQCWSLDLNFKDEDDEKRYAFTINLYGLGGFGADY